MTASNPTTLATTDRGERWRLILGKEAEQPLGAALGAGGRPLRGELEKLDDALAVVYGTSGASRGERGAGLGKSAPKLAKWLGDIRRYFPRDVVAVVQQDAIERQGFKQLLFEPELLSQVEPSVELAAMLLEAKGLIPEQTRETAREVVRQVAEQIRKRLEQSLVQAVRGGLDRSRHAPQQVLANFDVRTTIRRNLRHWDASRRQLVVERAWFHARRHRQFEWQVIVCLDQSGSMASSLVYGAVVASVLASLPALRTSLVAFDTEVVDLSDQVADPVDVLFGLQLGGGTDINRAVGYCQQLVTEPRKTMLLLISDLIEGGDQSGLVARVQELVQSGVKMVALLALDDGGAPAFNHDLARRFRGHGVPAFACTPNMLPALLEAALRGGDLSAYG